MQCVINFIELQFYRSLFSVNSFPTAADGQEAVAEADHSQQCHDTGELTAADSHQLAGQSSQLEEEGREGE